MVYSKVHRLIGEIAANDKPPEIWVGELHSVVSGFATEAARFNPRTARHIRDELCAQIEHEALAATREGQRTVLLTALKNLEAVDWHSSC